MVSASQDNEAFAVIYQSKTKSAEPYIVIVKREKQADETVQEEWMDVSLSNVQATSDAFTSLIKGKQALAFHMV